MKKVLHLSLRKLPFDVMSTGEKNQEFRKYSKWIHSRLFDKNGNLKNYDLVKFTNGYGKDKPYFICDFNGVKQANKNIHKEYSNGLIVNELTDVDYIIQLGNVIETGNFIKL
jgi:hypothetical protein